MIVLPCQLSSLREALDLALLEPRLFVPRRVLRASSFLVPIPCRILRLLHSKRSNRERVKVEGRMDVALSKIAVRSPVQLICDASLLIIDVRILFT